MDKILVDTNIIVDLLSRRQDFYIPASRLFTLSDFKKVKLSISALTFANTYYILSRELKADKVREVLRKFKLLVNVLPVNEKILDLALNSNFKDFEDAIQYYTALENSLEIIITRNLKDFKFSKIPVMTADTYLGMK